MPTLNWIGKEKVVTHHNDVPFRVLDRKYTFGDTPDSGNMIIHGDNLEALKALLPQYEGQIKCIYIDPPYNTGNEGWVYNDNVKDPRIQKWLRDVFHEKGITVDDLTRHDKWLCMMYPRLSLLQKLLANGGAIFISIDDNELANLRLLCDEIFEPSNFVGTFKWNRVAKAPSLSNSIRTKYEYILLYKKGVLDKIFGKESYNDLAPLWHNPNKQQEFVFPAGSIYIPCDFQPGIYSEKYQVELLDTMICKNGVNANEVHIKACASWGQKKIDDYIAAGNAFLVKKNLSTMYVKINGSYIAPSDLINKEECEVGTNTDSSEELKKMGINFVYSKPVSLIQYLIKMITAFDKDAIILDSFAGSGTTGQAVLNLNADGGNRKFILCEMGDYAESITAERIRRVISGYGEGKNAVAGTGGSFDFYELGETVFHEDGNLNESVGVDNLRQYIWYSETNTALCDDKNNGYFLGSHNYTDYYFYYEPEKETVLSRDTLNSFVKKEADAYIIYADICRLDKAFLQKHNITFKKIPRDVKHI